LQRICNVRCWCFFRCDKSYRSVRSSKTFSVSFDSRATFCKSHFSLKTYWYARWKFCTSVKSRERFCKGLLSCSFHICSLQFPFLMLSAVKALYGVSCEDTNFTHS
jgi:hypothetical protein